ncbi:hypothetical protein FJTKL_06699 [Diaporthe vaccinii]|uniref:Uncharacterized protein n=1 Tax=Diaporthe vaccinii TaxID=105482 RepID=A0ABR4EW89_9PEZI
MTPKRSQYSYTRVVTPDHPSTVPRMSETEMAQWSLEKEEHKFIAILTPYDARDSGEPMQDADPSYLSYTLQKLEFTMSAF